MTVIGKHNSTNPKFGYNMSIGGNKISFRKLDENKVIELFKLGNSAYTITTNILHTSVSKVSEILRRYNIEYGVNKQKVRTDKEIEVINYHKAGYGCRRIAKITSLSKTTILKILRRNDIQIRTVKERMNLRRNLSTLEIMPHESSASN